ncbi:LacI family DNA-binding transcriptional regulator [Micrococcales bacterium 31B]|nr:LacI family DNA-binding transcriptional regulator [Micrococcales bacterium 31B]
MAVPSDASTASHSPTIDHVAARAGVSTATVSRALRGLANVAPRTQAKVEAAVKELGYVPLSFAAALAGGKTGAIGIVAPWTSRWFTAHLINAVEPLIGEANYDLILYGLGGSNERLRRLLNRNALASRVDALMLINIPLTEDERVQMKTWGFPIVSVGMGHTPWPNVEIDDEAGGRLACEHLLLQGHRDIAYLSGDRNEELAIWSNHDRETGIKEAMAEAGLDLTRVIRTAYDMRGGSDAARRLLEHSDTLPTAIIAYCDETAFGAIGVLREHGLRVPEDVSVIGIDDHEMSSIVGLTTIRQDVRAQGTLAAQIMLRLLRGESVDASNFQQPIGLVERASVAPPREHELTGWRR